MPSINTNLKALAAQGSLNNVDKANQLAMQRLSTGLRINSAKDDAAGLAISNRMTSDVRGFAVAIRNANDGLSMAQTADGALGLVTDMLQRMRELAVQAGNGSLNTDNRVASQLEVDQLKQQIDNIATQTNFNNINLLDGSAGNIKLQTNVRANQQMVMSIDSAQTKDIGLGVRSSLTATGFTGTETVTPETQTVVISSTGTNTTAVSFLGVSTGVLAATTTTSIGDAIVAAKASILAGTAAQNLGLTDISNSSGTLTLTYGGLYGKGDVALFTAIAADSTGRSFSVGTEVTKGAVSGIAKNLAAGDMIINGIQIGASQATSDNVSFSDKSSSAISKVAAINAASGQTGVTATIGNTQLAGSAMVVGTASGTLVINGVSTSTIATVGDAGLDRAAVVTAVNNISQQTGVRAVDTGDINKGVILVADDARNVTLQYGVSGSLSSLNTGLSGFGVTLAPNTAAGISSSTGTTTAASGDKITINGVVAYTASAANQTQGIIVTAINTKTAQTGVTASIVAVGSNFGIQLTSTSGNVNVTGTQDLSNYTISNAYRSVNVAQTTAGTYQLGSSTNSPITISSTSNGNLSIAGLTAGTYSANTSVATTTDRSVATAAPSTTTTGLLQAGTLRINGSSIVAASTADDTSSAAYIAGTTTAITSSSKGASAIAIAAAINKSTASTGVTATASPNVVTGTNFSTTVGGSAVGIATIQAGALYVNGVTVSLASLNAGYTRGDVATLINGQQGVTGVAATDNGRGLTLTAADGRNISLGITQGLSAATVGISAASIGLSSDTVSSTIANSAATSATTYARVTLSSDKSFTVEGGSDGNANFSLLGFQTGKFGGADNGVKIAKIDITTQDGAQIAITALDAALKSVSLNQARLGAFQNRLDQVVSNLSTMSQNMSASRSRIQDTDYATETTNLAKSQIISQAATAMLAQANQSAQSVLALLK